MINELAYNNGVAAAQATFMKLSNVPVMSFPKKPMVPQAHAAPTPVAAAPAAAPAPVTPAAPQFGGAAAAPAPGAAAPGAPAAGGWKNTAKGFAKELGVQMAVPLGMMGIQKMMEPSQPKDPNAI